MLKEKYPDEVREILSRFPEGERRSAILPLLTLAQKEDGCISKRTLAEASELAGISPTQAASLSSFYTLLRDQPRAKRHVQICTDLPCALRGSEKFAAELCSNLGIRLGEATPDGEFFVEEVTCLAGCHKSPVFQVQDQTGVHYFESNSASEPMTAGQAIEILQSLEPQSKDK